MPQNYSTRDRETELLFTDALSPLAEGFPLEMLCAIPTTHSGGSPHDKSSFSLRKLPEKKRDKEKMTGTTD